MLSKPNFEYPEDRIARQNAAICEELAAHQVNLDAMSESEMRRLATRLASRLPEKSIRSLNLEEELMTQYQRVLDLQSEVIHDSDIPANQRAQVAGQVASVLQQLIKLQEDLDLQTTLRNMEAALIESLQLLPEDAQKQYFEGYEELARSKGL
jgi:hypothetical protein